jgi:biotin carboxyl carrier protein
MAGTLGEIAAMKYVTIINKQQFEIEILPDGKVLLNGKVHEIDFLQMEATQYSVIKDNKSLEVVIDEHENGEYEILMQGRMYEAQVLDERAMLMLNRRGGMKLDSGDMNSPMPGLIVQVNVIVGQVVTEGETLVILESMKMQNELKSPRSGMIQQVLVEKGQTVDKGALLLVVGDITS